MRWLLPLIACSFLIIAPGASALDLLTNARICTPAKATPHKSLTIPAGIIALHKIKGKKIKYPRKMQREHIQGNVVVKAMISRQGTIKSAYVISGPEGLREPTLKVILTWRYTPYIYEGCPVTVDTVITTVFSLNENDMHQKR